MQLKLHICINSRRICASYRGIYAENNRHICSLHSIYVVQNNIFMCSYILFILHICRPNNIYVDFYNIFNLDNYIYVVSQYDIYALKFNIYVVFQISRTNFRPYYVVVNMQVLTAYMLTFGTYMQQHRAYMQESQIDICCFRYPICRLIYVGFDTLYVHPYMQFLPAYMQPPKLHI